MLVNVKLDISGYNIVTFHWFTSFLMAHLKQNWQHWHSCIVDNLWELTNPAGSSVNSALRKYITKF